MKIVVIGAGVGGVLTVQNLHKKLPEAEITLIDNNNYFVFTPRLTEVLSEMVAEKYIVRPTDVFETKNVNVIIAKAERVDLEKKTVYLNNSKKISYDILVFAQGAKTNFFGNENLAKHCLQFKDYQDVDILKERILAGMREINRKTRDSYQISLVGGGATAVEVAFALKDYIKHHIGGFIHVKDEDINIAIFQSASSLVPYFPQKMIEKTHKEVQKKNIQLYLNHKVVDVQKNLILCQKDKYPFDITIWMAGVTPNQIPCKPQPSLTKGHMPVNKYLQVTDNVFAIGDCSLCLNEKGQPYPTTAQIAVQEAYHVSKNIVNLVKGKKLKPFNYHIRGNFLALGNHKTIADVFGFVFGGYLAWLLRDQYYKHVFRKLVKKM